MPKKSLKKVKLPQNDLSFTHLGFTNWKDPTIGFRSHGKSHVNAVEVMMVTHSYTTLDIGHMVSANYKEERKLNREMLTLILKNIIFLGREGLSLRGDGDEVNSNFIQLLKLNDQNLKIDNWLKKKSNKYTSPDIQNEILKFMAISISRKTAYRIQKVSFLH